MSLKSLSMAAVAALALAAPAFAESMIIKWNIKKMQPCFTGQTGAIGPWKNTDTHTSK